MRFSRDWDDNTEHGLTRDVAFNRHSMNDGEHVSPSNNDKVQIGTDDIKVRLVQGVPEEQFRKLMSRTTRATIGFDLTAPEPDPMDWEEMLKGGLQTALEDFVVVFEVSGVSRACTHQLVRSRRAAFHQQSMRASFYGDTPETRMPESVWRNPSARRAFLDALDACHYAYDISCQEDISYQDARFILPEATTNYILLEYPLREFLAVYAYRACHLFQWEIVYVMHECHRVLVEAHPWLDPYVKITCEKTHVCEFMGWENVEGQCTLPWAKEDNRRFKPQHHKIERKND